MILQTILGSAILGYFFGAIPIGYLVGQARGIDIRLYGSGRTGGTNVLRTLGARAALITVLGDITKGIAAVVAASILFQAETPKVVAGVFAIIGHSKSVFIGWRGGAGVATGSGAMLALYPPVFLLLLPVGIGLVLVTRVASVASITVACLGPIAIAYFVSQNLEPLEHIGFGLFGLVWGLFVHAGNLHRLIQGKERRIGEKS